MKSLKKIFIGFAAVAAAGVTAFCLCNSTSPEVLSENTKALSSAYCAYQPGKKCNIRWLDGDSYSADEFTKVGMDEVDETMHTGLLQILIRVLQNN